MSTPETPSTPPPSSTPAAAEATAGVKPLSAPTSSPTPSPSQKPGAAGPKPPPEPLTGFRAALEHTGLPRSVLLWKPRLPSRNWSIFLTVVGTISYLYYDDRRQAKAIKKTYIEKVQYLSKQPTMGSLDVPRKVTVYGARWPEDDDEDRALRHFRKYLKPYLVAAAIDYDQVSSPLHGSVTRQVHAAVLKKRRQALGLEAPDPFLSLPGALDPAAQAQRELEGGVILVGRPAIKEYLAGLKRGWSGGVDDWAWEKEVDGKIANDGVFDQPIVQEVFAPEPVEAVTSAPVPAATTAPRSLLGFLSRPIPTLPSIAPGASGPNAAPPVIPAQWHTPPSPLPAHPPVLLVPFVNHLGFKQIPLMIYDFFTERHRVRMGAEAAYALITNQTRPFTGPDDVDSVTSPESTPDTEFEHAAERWYKKSFAEMPKRMATARKDYYDTLAPRIESARQFARGERDLTPEEKKSDKPIVTEDDLRAERRKKELRWHGMLEGWDIIRPETETAWGGEPWRGWLRVFEPRDARND